MAQDTHQSIDDAFASMMVTLRDEPDIMEIIDDKMKESVETVTGLELANIDIRKVRELVEIEEFDPKYNVLNADVRNEFKNEFIYPSTYLFSQPVNTTNTIEGFISNVKFHESELILKVEPDENVIVYRCNYGYKKYPLYIEPIKIKKTNRGRKKKEKKKKDRKKQGSGEDFNSQISFFIRDPNVTILPGEVIPSDIKKYKFKLFRTGPIQLPGVRKEDIDDVVTCAKMMVKIINDCLHPEENNPTRISNIININPVMKNYRFIVKLPVDHIIDLSNLLKILTDEQNLLPNQSNIDEDDPLADRPVHPAIFMLKYTDQDPKLSIKFHTPINFDPDKKTRVNIFMRGKINILGAFSTETTRDICDYLHWIFETFYDDLIVPEGLISDSTFDPINDLTDNVFISDADAKNIFTEFCEWVDMKDIPMVTSEEVTEILSLAERYYDEQVEIAMKYVADLTL